MQQPVTHATGDARSVSAGQYLRLARGRIMRASVERGPSSVQKSVYRRAGRPCRRCGTLIEARKLGEHARTAYFCPSCQPPH